MEDVIMDKDSRTTGAVTHRLVRGLGIGVLGIIASLGLAGRVNATYFHSDNAGDYLDRGWYYLLDDGQYYTLIEDSIICSENWAICWDILVIRSCLKEIQNKRLDLQIE